MTAKTLCGVNAPVWLHCISNINSVSTNPTNWSNKLKQFMLEIHVGNSWYNDTTNDLNIEIEKLRQTKNSSSYPK